jgi:parallel beta helix pectate lyase-like protein
MASSVGSVSRRGFVGIAVSMSVFLSFAGIASARGSSGSMSANVGVSQGIMSSGVIPTSTVKAASDSPLSGSWATTPPSAQPLLPPPTSTATVAVPASIDATGATDVTGQLTRFFEHVQSGTTVVFPAHAIYKFDGSLVVYHAANLTIDGNGGVLKTETTGASAAPSAGRSWEWPRSRASIVLEDSSNVRIENLTVSGPNDPGGYGTYNPALEAQAGVDVESSSNVSITADTIRWVYGDFVYISGGSTNVEVYDNVFNGSGRQGVSVTNAQYVLIAHNSMFNAGRSAIDLEPGTHAGLADHVDIYDNEIVKAGLSFVAAQGNGPYVSNVNVVGNDLIDMPMDIQVRASDGSQRHNWMVLNNTTDYVQGSPVAPIEFWNVSGIVIEGNHQPMVVDRPSVAVYFQDPCNWAVRYNSFPGAEPTEPQGVAGNCGWTNEAR